MIMLLVNIIVKKVTVSVLDIIKLLPLFCNDGTSNYRFYFQERKV